MVTDNHSLSPVSVGHLLDQRFCGIGWRLVGAGLGAWAGLELTGAGWELAGSWLGAGWKLAGLRAIATRNPEYLGHLSIAREGSGRLGGHPGWPADAVGGILGAIRKSRANPSGGTLELSDPTGPNQTTTFKQGLQRPIFAHGFSKTVRWIQFSEIQRKTNLPLVTSSCK